MRSSSCSRAASFATAGFLLVAGGPALAEDAPRPNRFTELLLGASPTVLSAAAPASTPVATAPGSVSGPPASPARRDTLGEILFGRPVRGPAGPAAAAPVIRAPAPDPSSLLLLVVQLDELQLTDGMAAYGAPEDPLIPLGEFTRLLELDVDVLPGEGRVIGRLGEARRSLLIDLTTGTARVGGLQVSLKPDDVAITETEIYVTASALQKLLPLKLNVSPNALTMQVTALELLPIQGRLQRAQRSQQAATDPSANKALRVETPYQLITPPSFDVALGLGAQTQDPQYPLRYDVRLGGDLAFAGLQAYIGSDESGRANTARVLLERKSLSGGLLGPLHATSVGVGDVFTPSLAIGPAQLRRAAASPYPPCRSTSPMCSTASTCGANCRSATMWSSTSTTSCAGPRTRPSRAATNSSMCP